METIVLGWYVMVNTGSVLLLTVFGSLQFLGTLAAPMFGVLGDRLGGRVMGVRTLAVYGLPLGLMTSGALIERLGYRPTVSALTALGLVCTLAIGIRWRAVMWRAS